MDLFLKVLLAPLIPVAVILGIVILVGIVAGIVSAIFGKGKDPAKKDPAENAHEAREKIEEKYVARGILKKHEDAPWKTLIRLGREALNSGDLNAAREYLEDSHALTLLPEATLPLMEYYVTAGEREKAEALLKEELEARFPEADVLFQGILLHLAGQPSETLEKGFAAATKYGHMRDGTYKLYCAAKATVVKDAADSFGAKAREARQLAQKGDPDGAATLCKGLYTLIADNIEKKDRPKYQQILTELAWQTAVYCCGAGTYQHYEVAEAYLRKEDCSRYPTYYYIHMLARTRGGVSGFEDTDFLRKALYTDVERAIREGLPGAEQVKEKLHKTYLRAVEIGLDNARFALEQIKAEEAFEEAHGMSREEYKERQKEAAEERARSQRADQLRKKIELSERFADLLTGGTGYSMEEQLVRGDISYADHERYSEAKEKYIRKKSQ